MPALGESVTEGTVTRWLKKEGDLVKIDEPLLEVSTDKVDTEIPSPAEGVLQKIIVQIDQTVAVGTELAVIDSATSANSAPVQKPAEPVAAQVNAVVNNPAPVATPSTTNSTSSTSSSSSITSSSSASQSIVVMPALGESVTEGTVTRWLKKVGESVNVDEPLLEVSTDKVDTEIPAPASGTLQSIEVPVDSTVPVGARLAIISAGSAATVATPKPSAPQPAPVSKPQSVAAPVVSAPTVTVTKPAATTPVATVNTFSNSYANVATATTKTSDLYVTPIVRKLANENGVNLASITGTGIGGRIRKEDVLAAIARPTISNLQAQSSQTNVSANGNTARVDNSPRPAIVASPLRGTSVQMSRLRKVIADRMVESLKISAQLTTVVEVDVTKIARLREKAKSSFEAREGVKLSFLPFFAVAVCEALKQHPVLNSSVVGDQINYHNAEHLGIAVDTERGLLVPVIKDAGDLNMGGIARRIADVAARTRDNKISPDDLSGGTFTLTNTGSRGALFDTPIINQPQVAILGLGAVVKRPMVMRGEDGGETIAIRSMVYLALSYDHRVVDGADAARFLVTLKERLEEGRFESDLGL